MINDLNIRSAVKTGLQAQLVNICWKGFKVEEYAVETRCFTLSFQGSPSWASGALWGTA